MSLHHVEADGTLHTLRGVLGTSGRLSLWYETAGGTSEWRVQIMTGDWRYALPISYAASFDGVGSFVDAEMSRGALGTHEAWTIETWLRPLTLAGRQPILCSSTLRYTVVGGCVIEFENGRLNKALSIELDTPLQRDVWVHLGLTFSCVNVTIEITVNGEIAKTLKGVEVANVLGSQEWEVVDGTIGLHRDSASGSITEAYRGLISRFRVWSTQRTVAEIQACMNTELDSKNTPELMMCALEQTQLEYATGVSALPDYAVGDPVEGMYPVPDTGGRPGRWYGAVVAEVHRGATTEVTLDWNDGDSLYRRQALSNVRRPTEPPRPGGGQVAAGRFSVTIARCLGSPAAGPAHTLEHRAAGQAPIASEGDCSIGQVHTDARATIDTATELHRPTQQMLQADPEYACACYSHDGARIAAACSGAAVVWDGSSSARLACLIPAAPGVVNRVITRLHYTVRYLAAAYQHDGIRLWNTESWTCSAFLPYGSAIADISSSSDGLRIAAATSDGVSIWDLTDAFSMESKLTLAPVMMPEGDARRQGSTFSAGRSKVFMASRAQPEDVEVGMHVVASRAESPSQLWGAKVSAGTDVAGTVSLQFDVGDTIEVPLALVWLAAPLALVPPNGASVLVRVGEYNQRGREPSRYYEYRETSLVAEQMAPRVWSESRPSVHRSVASICWSPDDRQLLHVDSSCVPHASPVHSDAVEELLSGSALVSPEPTVGLAFAHACRLLGGARATTPLDRQGCADALVAFEHVASLVTGGGAASHGLASTCHNEMGFCLTLLGRPGDALARYELAAENGEGHKDAPIWLTNYGIALCATGRLSEASVCFETVRIKPLYH